MPEMGRVAKAFCRSAPWRALTGRVVLPWSLQGLSLSGDVLEIGCGSGAMAAEILRHHRDVRLTATDYDESMVETAERRLPRFGERASVRQADATALPFADASFDAVLSFIMLHHVIQWEQAISEAVRVLRPGGRLIGYDLLGDRFGRILHAEKDTRLMKIGELRDVLAGLEVNDAHTRRGGGGFVVRFRATKRLDISETRQAAEQPTP